MAEDTLKFLLSRLTATLEVYAVGFVPAPPAPADGKPTQPTQTKELLRSEALDLNEEPIAVTGRSQTEGATGSDYLYLIWKTDISIGIDALSAAERKSLTGHQVGQERSCRSLRCTLRHLHLLSPRSLRRLKKSRASICRAANQRQSTCSLRLLATLHSRESLRGYQPLDSQRWHQLLQTQESSYDLCAVDCDDSIEPVRRSHGG